MGRYFFVVNPQCSNGSNLRYWEQIHPQLRQAFPAMEYAFTQYSGHGSLLTKVAIREGYDRIISVGGDGTNFEVLNGFLPIAQEFSHKLAMGFVPCGTGNDFCRTVGLSQDIEEVIAVLQKDQLICADLGLLSCVNDQQEKVDKLFLNVASFGLTGTVVKQLVKIPRILPATGIYAWSTLKAARSYKKPSLTIKAFQGNELTLSLEDQTCLNVIIGNGQYFGGGIKIAPDAKINDGLLDLLVLGDLSIFEIISNFPRVFFGGHVNHGKVRAQSVRRIEATSSDTVLIEADGEFIGQLPLELSVLHQAINLILP